MEISLPLNQMTVAEKLRLTEEIRADLSRGDKQFESPEWHREVLHDRVARVADGKESFIDWETAKQQLRDKLK
jgi:hypothetical protein